MKTDQDLDNATRTLYRAFINHDPAIDLDDIEKAAFTLRVAATAHPNPTVRELAADIGIAASEPSPEPMRLATAALTQRLGLRRQPKAHDTQLAIFAD